jgi:MFS family permease
LVNFGHTVPFSYMTARGILLGYSDTHSAILASLVGVGSGVGRLAAGFGGSRASVKLRVLACGTGVFLAGLASMLSYCSNSFWFLGLYCGIWGFLAGTEWKSQLQMVKHSFCMSCRCLCGVFVGNHRRFIWKDLRR